VSFARFALETRAWRHRPGVLWSSGCPSKCLLEGACSPALHAPSCEAMTEQFSDRQIQAIERPDKSLLKYYLLVALAALPAFPVVALVLYFRYHTMRYKFTDDGISMGWGILFRRQIIVNYARIQDIHLQSNIVERWLGLGRILIQTASGSHSAEMTIEGIKEFEPLRDFLYSRMRGVKDGHGQLRPTGPHSTGAELPANSELAAALREAASELRAVRQVWEKHERDRKEGTRHV
jgi:uncharacterized protein